MTHATHTRSRFLAILTALGAGTALPAGAAARLVALAPGVHVVPGDIEGALTCNTGVIEAGGRLTLVDAAVPDGAAAAYRAVRAASSLPLAHVIDTHYHLDHTYGNAFWSDHGAQPVAVRGLERELAVAEPELFGRGPGLWQKMAASLPALRTSRPMAPHYVASGTQLGSVSRPIAIIHPGVGHTHSDAVVWLPHERVLFTGDLVVNGPFNAVADSTIGAWIATLDRLRRLRPLIVVPGHGPAGGAALIDRQQQYFRAVTSAVATAIASGKSVAEQTPDIRAAMLRDPKTRPFVNEHHRTFSGFFAFRDLVGKIYHEQTGTAISAFPTPARCCGDLRRAYRGCASHIRAVSPLPADIHRA